MINRNIVFIGGQMRKNMILEFKEWFESALFEAVVTKIAPNLKYRGKQFDVFVIIDPDPSAARSLQELGFLREKDEPNVFTMMRNSKYPIRTKFGPTSGFDEIINNPNWVDELSALGVDTTPIGPKGKKPSEAAAAPPEMAKPTTAPSTTTPTVSKPETKVVAGPVSSLCDKVLNSPDQKKVDESFAKILSGGKNGHIVINARAGSGKTTILKCLWEKYGKPSGGKWLYLVFNKKNEQEAKEKFGEGITVRTTNSYLNHVLQKSRNMHQTSYAGVIKPKMKVVMDTTEFKRLKNQLNMPNKAQAERDFAGKQYSNVGIRYFDRMEDLMEDAGEKLADISKQFGINPYDKDQMDLIIDSLLERYDIFQDLDNLYDQLDKTAIFHNSREFDEIYSTIRSLEPKNEEKINIVKEIAKWLLENTAPGNTKFDDVIPKWEVKNSVGMVINRVPFSKVRDFNDDFWYIGINPDKIDWHMQKYDVVLADEIQDFNAMQKKMLEKLAEQGANIVAVGDPNQAIYRFRGAENTSFQDIENSLVDLHTKTNPEDTRTNVVHTMPKNRRSRKNIIDYVNANTVVKDLETGRDYSGEDGENHGVITERSYKPKDIANAIKSTMTGNKLDKSTAILARTNEPLAQVAIDLFSKGIPFTFIGKDFAGEMVSFIDKTLDPLGIDNSTTLNSVFNPQINQSSKIRSYLDKQISKYGKVSTKKQEIKELAKNVEILESIASVLQDVAPDVQTVGDMKNWIRNFCKANSVSESSEQLKNDDHSMVILTTVHKSKGFEYDKVFILDPSNFPIKRARFDADKEQEENAKYIAYTRARDELHIVDDSLE